MPLRRDRESAVTRRRVLAAGAGSVLMGSSGCLGGRAEDRSGTPAAFASAFTLAEFARAVGGDELRVENPVDVGSHGHEWEPSADLLPNVVDADAFVHLDVEGFQPWADDVAGRVAADHDDVTLIDATDGIDLLRYDDHSHDDTDHSHDTDDTDHSHDIDNDTDHSHDTDDTDHSHDIDNDTDHSHDTDDTDDDHTHGEYDAKFFTDPVLAQRSVRNVRDGLIEIDPDNRAVYRRNAAAYVERLQAVHDEYDRALSDREHDVVVLAGHDSFQYLGERYGFDVHTPVGLSPDHDPTPGELARAVDLVEREGIDCVLWDHFDGPDAAALIAEEADHDVDTEMVSPAENTTREWLDAGVGSYLAQLEEITLPAFERALGATEA
ncbi:metal ABC transporter substrate-binding protein [Halorubrum sp. DTA98]|uniref:metal ABC transporter substrate-binding protein n=1 Tax=Halorubrum sp. DTA98 TaxID=3402163 RepID=UPI003AADD34F